MRQPQIPGHGLDRIAQPGADRLGHGDMSHQPLVEKGLLARESAVDELIDDHEGAGGQVLAQRPDGGEREDLGHARALHGVDVGPEVQAAGRDAVTAPVTRQEDQFLAVQFAEQKLVGGGAEGTFDPAPLLVFQAFDLVDAAAADDADDRLRCLLHGPCPAAPVLVFA